jgi:FkbM family methyltransferase
MNLYDLKYLRAVALPLLKKFSFDTNIQHHWVPSAKLKLNTFRHKGYWYHGKSREHETMMIFKDLIKENDVVVEVGGHIGYISIFFSHLVGENGSVIVFEPGTNNLPYITHNIKNAPFENHMIKQVAVGQEEGTATFYEDDLTGQNNSLVRDFDGFSNNSKNSFVDAKVHEKTVKVTTLDLEFYDRKVDFIKIDIEGGEWPAMLGAEKIIKNQCPILMVEIQADREDIFQFMSDHNYIGFDEHKFIIKKSEKLNGNIFWVNKIKHHHLINSIGLKTN